MKVIFWDVDGVLNNPGTWGAWSKLGWSAALEPHLVKKARDVVRATGAKCVLSSTWRIGAGLERTIECLKERGWPEAAEDFVGATPYLGTARGQEIGAWLIEHPEVEHFVIVDDASDMTTHVNRLVRTNYAVGLEDHHCEMIRAMLS